MKIKTLILLIAIPLSAFAQNGVTFQIEELSKPKESLPLNSFNEICENLILFDASTSRYETKKKNMNSLFNIIAKSQLSDSLVDFGYHSFFGGMYRAYADHRPFVLSPDMIWLLISQGFAQHIHANSEALRHYFVDFSGKETLIVETNEITLDNPNSPWEKIFPEFTKQVAAYTGSEFINVLTADFTTTTPVEKMASEITIMETMKPYFDYTITTLCGIPEITLQGTTEDWQKILEKTKQLEKYDLQWWTNALEPILEEFIKASKGEINKEFWRNMFKVHSQKEYGKLAIIDGWIVRFFPYDNKQQRNNLKELEYESGRNLPNEIVKVDLKYINLATGETTPLELWAGFFGVEQNKENFALTPKIGWMIRKKDIKGNK